MRRQLRASGGITNARQMAAFGGIMGSDGRKQYGIGSWLKEKIRKIIPNELADIAVKAAPFVAPFNPAIAAGMAGLGSFDKTGRIGSSLKAGAMNYAGGQAARYLGGAGVQGNPFSADGGAFRGGLEGIKGGFSSPLGTDTGFKLGTEGTGTNNPLSDGNDGAKKFAEDQGKGFMERTTDKIFDKIPFGNKLNQTVKEKLLVGGVTSAATYLYEKFVAGYPEPKPGEDMAAYMAERRQRVGTQMRTYMDNYLAYDPQYSAMSDAEKDAFVERNNKNMGGLMRTGYANGSGGITMANTLAQNVAQNRANQTARANELEMARSRLPGYQAPQRAMAPTKAPMLTPADLNPPQLFQPGDPDLNIGIPERPQLGVTPPVERIIPSGGMDFSLPGMTTVMPQLPRTDEEILTEREKNNLFITQPGFPDSDGDGIDDRLSDEEKERRLNPIGGGTLEEAPLTDEEILAERKLNPPKSPGFNPRYEGRYAQDPGQRNKIPVGGYKEPLPQDQLMAGFEEYVRNNPYSGAGTTAIVPVTLPGGYSYNFSGSQEANAFGKYLESIGQAPAQGRRQPGDLAKIGFPNEGLRKIISDGRGLAKLAVGGRVGQNMGGLMRLNYMIGGEAKQMEAGAPPIMYSGNMDPNAQAGLPSVPGPMQMAEDGPEFDMRENGGFQPLGRQEGKDDVPAMLAKNEFVMTADAVRAAGGGSIQKGAQKMYDTMKKLESRVS